MAPDPPSVAKSSDSHNELTVFQAAPLVWRDENDKYQAFPFLDLDDERKILTNSLKEAENNGITIKLDFQIATVERLGKFLAYGNAQMFHFSGHGFENFVAFEDRNGGAHFLTSDDLKQLFVAGRKKLQFVFVAACCSELTGQAFIGAGVPHVICCEKGRDIMNNAAVMFSHQLYLSLASGKTLAESFDLAKETVGRDPLILDAEAEVKKFILLPKDTDHNVQLVFPRQRQDTDGFYGQATSRLFSHLNIPHPPRELIGREEDMYKVLQKLRPLGKLIKIKGGAGSGVRSIAKAVARYVSVREHSFSINEVIWLPFWQTPERDTFLFAMKGLIDLLESGSASPNKSDEYNRLWTQVCSGLNGKSVLIIIDPEEFQQKNFIVAFLSDIFDRIGVKFASVIVVCEGGFDPSGVKKCSEAEITVDPLDFQSTALLFGRTCRFLTGSAHSKVCTPSSFVKVIAAENDVDLSQVESKAYKLWKAIGKGIPSNVHAAAKQITQAEFDDLIEFAQKSEVEARGMSPVFSFNVCAERNESQRVSAGVVPVGRSSKHPQAMISASLSDTIPSLQLSDGESSSGDEIDEWIGIDFDSSALDVQHEGCYQYIMARKRKMEKDMTDLIRRFGKNDTVVGEPELIFEVFDGRAVVRIECEFELRDDIRRKDIKRVKQILKGVAKVLENLGATDEELDLIMVGTLWKGSLNIFLKAPLRVLDLMIEALKRSGGTLPFAGGSITGLAPAFSLRVSPSTRIAERLRPNDINVTADVLLYKMQGMEVLVPTSRAANIALVSGGMKLMKCQDVAEDVWKTLPSIACIVSADIAEAVGAGELKVKKIILSDGSIKTETRHEDGSIRTERVRTNPDGSKYVTISSSKGKPSSSVISYLEWSPTVAPASGVEPTSTTRPAKATSALVGSAASAEPASAGDSLSALKRRLQMQVENSAPSEDATAYEETKTDAEDEIRLGGTMNVGEANDRNVDMPLASADFAVSKTISPLSDGLTRTEIHYADGSVQTEWVKTNPDGSKSVTISTSDPPTSKVEVISTTSSAGGVGGARPSSREVFSCNNLCKGCNLIFCSLCAGCSFRRKNVVVVIISSLAAVVFFFVGIYLWWPALIAFSLACFILLCGCTCGCICKGEKHLQG